MHTSTAKTEALGEKERREAGDKRRHGARRSVIFLRGHFVYGGLFKTLQEAAAAAAVRKVENPEWMLPETRSSPPRCAVFGRPLQEAGETALHYSVRTADQTSLHLVDFLVQNR